MNGGAPPFMPMPAAPAGAAPAQPQGIWGGVPPQQGFMSNPMVMAGIMGLANAASGQPSGPGMARGYALGQQAQDNAWSRQMQSLQMAKLMRDEAKNQETEKALASLVDNPDFKARLGVNADLWAALPMDAKADIAKEMFKPTGWTPKALRSEFDASEFPAEVWAQAEREGNAGVLQDYIAANTPTKPTLGNKEFMSYAKKLDATPESIQAAQAAGNDITMLEPRDVRSTTPASRSEVSSFLNTADKRMQPYRKAFRTINQMRKALEGDSSLTDIMSTYLLIKTFDPDSVVREGEIALVNAAKPIRTKLEALAQKERQAGFLTPTEKSQVAGLMNDLQGLYQVEYDRALGTVQNRAGIQNMPEGIMSSVQVPQAPPVDLWEGTTDPAYWADAEDPTAVPGGPAPGAQAAWPEWALNATAARLLQESGIDPTEPGARKKLIEWMERRQAAGTQQPMPPGMGGPGGVWAGQP